MVEGCSLKDSPKDQENPHREAVVARCDEVKYVGSWKKPSDLRRRDRRSENYTGGEQQTLRPCGMERAEGCEKESPETVRDRVNRWRASKALIVDASK